MRRWSMWVASALGAVGAGAGLAVARRRRPASEPARMLPAPSPAGHAAGADAVDAVTRAEDDVAPALDAADDPQEALDAARARLRERADRLRRDIDAAGGSSGGV
jgi:hypothetical protein